MFESHYITYCIVGTACIVLVVLFLRGRADSLRAYKWCQRQMEQIQSRKASSDDCPPEQTLAVVSMASEGPCPLDERKAGDGFPSKPSPPSSEGPCPLDERKTLLEKMAPTSLAEGDMGSFLLRRDEVPGQYVAAHVANVLVSIALFGTILGLIVTLWGLGLALGSSALLQAGEVSSPNPSDLLETIVRRIQGPLSHLPLLFGPTAWGLLLAVFSIRRQYWIDEKIEETWKEIDRYTQDVLLPQYLTQFHSPFLKILQRQEEATAGLTESSGRFGQAASRLEEAFSSVRQALSELGKLDQSRWAQDLMKAAHDFRKQISSSGEILTQASQEISDGLAVLPNIADRLKQAAGQVDGAGEAVVRAASQLTTAAAGVKETLGLLADVQQNILDLDDHITSLATSVHVLSSNFLNWSQTQQQFLQDLKQTVMALLKAVHLLLDQTQGLHAYIRDNAPITQQALQQVAKQFSSCNRELAAVCQQQQATFGRIAEQIADSLREGHQRFLAEVKGRFDQGEGLYQRLEDLRLTIDHNAGALHAVGERLVVLSPLLETQRSTAETIEGILKEVQDMTKRMVTLLQEQATWDRQRGELWWQRLQEQSQQQSQTLREIRAQAEEQTQALQEIQKHLSQMSSGVFSRIGVWWGKLWRR